MYLINDADVDIPRWRPVVGLLERLYDDAIEVIIDDALDGTQQILALQKAAHFSKQRIQGHGFGRNHGDGVTSLVRGESLSFDVGSSFIPSCKINKTPDMFFFLEERQSTPN